MRWRPPLCVPEMLSSEFTVMLNLSIIPKNPQNKTVRTRHEGRSKSLCFSRLTISRKNREDSES